MRGRQTRRFFPTVDGLEPRYTLDGDATEQFPLFFPDGMPGDPLPGGDFDNPPAYYDPTWGAPLAVRPVDDTLTPTLPDDVIDADPLMNLPVSY